MVINLDPELEAALSEQAQRQGVAPDALAIDVLRQRFIVHRQTIQPRDEWEQALLQNATDCGVSLPDDAVSSEGLYD
jgi:hypothetical protein